eukprot:GHVR01004410.1.p1 GENE.GHVR01004410.1~~GHVR01004410.1.p1  ORF type:complete len:387 (-),score=65.69 GHVR01004410.1:23-1162(-)
MRKKIYVYIVLCVYITHKIYIYIYINPIYIFSRISIGGPDYRHLYNEYRQTHSLTPISTEDLYCNRAVFVTMPWAVVYEYTTRKEAQLFEEFRLIINMNKDLKEKYTTSGKTTLNIVWPWVFTSNKKEAKNYILQLYTGKKVMLTAAYTPEEIASIVANTMLVLDNIKRVQINITPYKKGSYPEAKQDDEITIHDVMAKYKPIGYPSFNIYNNKWDMNIPLTMLPLKSVPEKDTATATTVTHPKTEVTDPPVFVDSEKAELLSKIVDMKYMSEVQLNLRSSTIKTTLDCLLLNNKYKKDSVEYNMIRNEYIYSACVSRVYLDYLPSGKEDTNKNAIDTYTTKFLLNFYRHPRMNWEGFIRPVIDRVCDGHEIDKCAFEK